MFAKSCILSISGSVILDWGSVVKGVTLGPAGSVIVLPSLSGLLDSHPEVKQACSDGNLKGELYLQ